MTHRRYGTPGSAGDSRACERVDVAAARGQLVLIPGVSAVIGPEDLTEARNAIDLIGIARMQRHGHHGGLCFHGMIEALPGLAQVLSAEDGTVLAPRRGAHAYVHHARILR